MQEQQQPQAFAPAPAPIVLHQQVPVAPMQKAPAPIVMQQSPQQQYQQPPSSFMQKPQTPKPVQNSLPRSFPPPKSPVQFNQPPPKSPLHMIQAPSQQMSSVHFNQVPPQQMQPIQTQQFNPKIVGTAPSKMSPSLNKQRAGLNASPVTPGILKKQIQVDAAVPRMPGSTTPVSKQPAKSPVPFMNTTAVPFGYQSAGSIQTAESLAQLAPISPAPAYNPKPMPLIVSTPIPKFSNNFNLSASGFGVHRDYYRPTHMNEGKKLVAPVVYTDF